MPTLLRPNALPRHPQSRQIQPRQSRRWGVAKPSAPSRHGKGLRSRSAWSLLGALLVVGTFAWVAQTVSALPPLGFYDIDLGAGPYQVDEGDPVMINANIVNVGCGSLWSGVVWDITIDHTNSQPADLFSVTPSQANFSDAQTMVPITISTDDDANFEGLESLDLVLTALAPTLNCTAPNGTWEPNFNEYRVTVEIIDDESPGAHFSVDDIMVSEGDNDANFRVRLLDPDAGVTTEVDVVTMGGSAIDGQDYMGINQTTLTFMPGVIEQLVPIDLIDDATPEATEDFFLLVSNPVNATIDTPSATCFIDDNEAQPELVIKDVALDEGDAGSPNVAISVEMINGPAPMDVTVDWTTLDGTATTSDNDYLPAGGTVTFLQGSVEEDILVPVVGDLDPELDEFFEVKLFNSFGALITDGEGQVLIRNDDGPVGSFRIDDVEVTEGDESFAELTVVLDDQGKQRAAASGNVSVQFATLDGTAVANEDYVPKAGVLDFSGGESQKTIQIQLLDNDLAEAEETFRVQLKLSKGAPIDKEFGIVTIKDTDTAQPRILIDDPEVQEGDEGSRGLIFAISLDQAPDQVVSVDYQTADGSATEGDGDYQSVQGTVSFAPGQTQQTVEVPVFGDTRIEDDETLALRLTSPQGGFLDRNEATGTILNDDEAGLPQLAAADISVTEGAADSMPAILTVSLTPASESVVTVDFATVAGTAVLGFDFQGTSGTLTFQPNETEQSVEIQIRDDNVEEAVESFFVGLSNPDGADIADDQAEITIVDDDAGGGDPPGIAIRDSSVVEGDSGIRVATFTVNLSAPSSGIVSADYRTVDGTAMEADNDYQASLGQVVFQPGEILKTIEVGVVGDTRQEDDERFGVELSQPVGGLLVRATATCLIVDDDSTGGGTPSLIRLVRAETATEGAGPVTIVAERLGGVTTPARVLLVTVPGTARGGDDYQPTEQVLQWPAGQRGSREVSIPIVDDNTEEGEERFFVVLRNPAGAELGLPRQVPVVILDNDAPMRLEAVGEQELTVKTRDELSLQVRVVSEGGAPIEGATVEWEAEGRARILDDGRGQSNGDGLANQVVVFANQPGPARIVARLLGTTASVAFIARVEGGLAETVGEEAPGGGAGGVADVIDQGCADEDGSSTYSQVCEFLFGLDDPNDQRQAVDRLTPRNALAQARTALRAPTGQIRNVSARLTALRAGTSPSLFSQLAMSLHGESLSLGPLQAAVTNYNPADEQLAKRLAAALGRAQDTTEEGRQARAEGDLRLADSLDQGSNSGGSGPSSNTDLDPYDSTESPWGFFLNGRVSFGDVPRRGQEVGSEFTTEGLTAGIDYRVSNRMVVGAALGYLRSDNDANDKSGSVEMDGTSLSLYLTYYVDDFYLDSVVSYGRSSYDIERVIQLPRALSGQQRFVALGKPDSDQLAVNVSLGYDFLIGDALTLSGFLRGSWVRAEIDAYQEEGTLLFDLAFQSQEAESLLGEVGAEITYPWSFSWGVLQPLVRIAFLHEFEDDPRVVQARFLRDPSRRTFRLEGQGSDPDFFNLALGVTATLQGGWATYFQYDTDIERDDLDIYTLSGGFRFQF